MRTLEDRYRRLLAWYPADHRSGHEEEMLEVLLAAARPGQTRPSFADAADLLYGAVRIRLRRATGEATGSAWPRALAMAGFLATVLLVADGVRFLVNAPHGALDLMDRMGSGESLPFLLASHFATGPYWVAWAAIAVSAWRGRRRPARLAACAVTAVQFVVAVYGAGFHHLPWAWLATSLAGPSLPLAMLVTASLVASPGPRHGARLLGRRRVAGAAAMAVVLVAFTALPLFTLISQGNLGPLRYHDVDQLDSLLVGWADLRLAAVITTAVLGAAALSRTHEGRRGYALLALFGTPLLVREALTAMDASSSSAALAPLLTQGVVGFALTMLCVRLIELSSTYRRRDRQRIPA
ncbi:hypothetical protein ABZ801_02455 [Actinomadura sp. NPDC047616]|uniref:hypothetical protein n=1 Tax=Actinomadura sp. NPDC047616 TaxID=3155914 RepID=UPI0033EC3D74